MLLLLLGGYQDSKALNIIDDLIDKFGFKVREIILIMKSVVTCDNSTIKTFICIRNIIIDMSISLILIGVISLVVIAGTAYLFISKNQELTEDKKVKILLIVGTVIFVSFLVTTFKHRRIVFASRDADDGAINIKKVFFGDGCNFPLNNKNSQLFQMNDELVSEIYSKNYQSIYDQPITTELKQLTKNYQEIIVYLSKKNEGASYFLNYLAIKKCRDMRMPVLYLDLEKDYKKESEFLEEIGVASFEQLQKYMCHFSGIEKKETKYGFQYVSKVKGEHGGPYLLIDNFEKLIRTLSTVQKQKMHEAQFAQIQPKKLDKNRSKASQKLLLFSRILDELVGKCRVNIILNTQKQWAVQQIYEIWQQIEHIGQNQQKKNKKFFQYHRWQPLNQYNIYKILSKTLPNNDISLSKLMQLNKQDSFSYKQLFMMIGQLKSMIESKNNEIGGKIMRDELQLKEWNVKFNVAKYFGLEQTYRLLKATSNKRISYLKNKVQIIELRKLEQIGLIEVFQGLVILK